MTLSLLPEAVTPFLSTAATLSLPEAVSAFVGSGRVGAVVGVVAQHSSAAVKLPLSAAQKHYYFQQRCLYNNAAKCQQRYGNTANVGSGTVTLVPLSARVLNKMK